MISAKDKMTLSELTARPKSERLFVLNTSANLTDDGAGGDVFVTVNREGGEATPVMIPLTSIPVELTALVPRRDLLRSGRFLDAVSRGILTPIKPDAALRELETPDAIVEVQRMQARRDAVRAALKSQRSGRTKGKLLFDEPENNENEVAPVLAQKPVGIANGGVSFSAPKGGRATPPSQTASFSEPDSSDYDIPLRDVTPQFKAIVASIKAMPEAEARNKLKTMGELELYKVEYLRDNTNHQFIKKWARKVLGE